MLKEERTRQKLCAKAQNNTDMSQGCNTTLQSLSGSNQQQVPASDEALPEM
jgi:hypothetical protein